jgi:hypothetical protein
MANPVFESRVLRWLSRTLRTGALATEIMRVVNKTPLIGLVRRLVDVVSFRKRSRRAVPELRPGNQREEAMLNALRRNGWVSVPDDVGMDLRRSIQGECLALRRKYHEMKSRDPQRYKDIWNYISDAGFGRERPDQSNIFVQYALSKPILNVVAAYLGETPWLRYIILTESVYQKGNLKYSQKWHYDYDDARMAKLFIYLSDVQSSDDGPFRLIPRQESERVRNSFVKRHLDDEEVFAHANPANVVDMMGPALTSFIADPGKVYHCGSRLAPGHTRLLYTALYTAYPSIYPNGREMFTADPDLPGYLRHVLTPTSTLTQR